MLIRSTYLLLALVLSIPAQAALTIQGARVIYEEARGETTVHLQYTGDTASLLQVWLDPADSDAPPGHSEVPFILSPAITRLEPDSGQSIRVLRIEDAGLAHDRETLFYFNTLEVPPAPTAQIAAGDPYMQFSIRGRLKFFYRPRGLPLKPEQAFERLQFSLAETLPDGRLQLRIHNPSPYHITFSQLRIRDARDMEDTDTRPLLGFNYRSRAERMVAPMQELLMALEWVEAAPGAALPEHLRVDFSAINDVGGTVSRQMEVK